MTHSFRRHWLTLWPIFALAIGLLTLAAAFFGWFARANSEPQWWAISIFSILVLILFLFLQFWSYLQTATLLRQLPAWILRKGRISPEDNILFPYSADSRVAPHLIRQLSTGKVWFVDIYSPADMRSAQTRRSRAQDHIPGRDPRIKFIPGDIALLPIQDGEIDLVVLTDIVNSITQSGDRVRFLEEVSRVLKPNGRILVIEPLKSLPRFLVDPVENSHYWTKTQLDKSLISCGFSRIELQTVGGLTILGRAITPGRYENSQLPLEF